MPVVLEIAPEMSGSRNTLAEQIQTRVRELLSRHENIRALEPVEIAMAAPVGGETSHGSGGPATGSEHLPAQAELFLTASSLGSATELEREPTPEIDLAVREAVDFENRSDLLRADAGRRESRIEEMARSAYLAAAGDVDKEAALECRDAAAQSITCGGDWECNNRAQLQVRDCQEGVRNRLVQSGTRAAEDERARLKSEVMGIRAEAESLKARGAVLKRSAAAASEDARVTRRVRAAVSVGWRLVDSRWRLLIKSGTTNGTGASEEKGLTKGSVAEEASGRSKTAAVVFEAVDEALEKIAAQVSDAMGAVSPRAKVVKTEPAQVTINAGSALGAAVGDTFGLVNRGVVLTDPDTGLALEAPPAPTGKYRVVQVEELVSTLSVVEKSGPVKRGDELEWIGVYGPYSSKRPAAPLKTVRASPRATSASTFR